MGTVTECGFMETSTRGTWSNIPPLLPPRGSVRAPFENLLPPSEQRWRNLHLFSETVEQVLNHSPSLSPLLHRAR